MIEKIVHQIWYQGEKECPEKHQAKMKTWKQNHDTWKYMFWDEEKMQQIIKQEYPQYYKRWSTFNHMHQRIDFFKYILMDKYGGLYADIDTICLKPIDPLLKYDDNKSKVGQVIVCKTASTDWESWITFGTTESVNNGILISTKGHPFWRWYMDKIMKQSGPWLTKFSEINNTTGPAFFSKCIWEYKGEGITILNHKTFEPCFHGDPYCKVGKDSYADHQHDQTWIDPISKWLSHVYYYLKGNWGVIVLILIIIATIMYKIF